MYTIQPKKLLIVNIFDILNRYTDLDHRISQKGIIEILKKEYEIKVDRKAVKRNLLNLLDFGYDIAYSKSIRINKNGEEETIYSDWYMNHKFDDSELRLLIDSLLFSKHIPYSQCKELIKKIEGLSNIYFKQKVKHICNLQSNMPTNKQLFYTIDTLNAGISKGRQVVFEYCFFDVYKKMHPRKNESGEVREYIVNPYQMVATNGRYYLICNYDKYDDISNYRVDRIHNIRLLDTNAKPFKSVNGIDLQAYMKEHIYMFSGKSIRVKFKAKRYITNDIIDYFGLDVSFSDVDGNDMIVTVKIGEEDMFKWAMQYCDNVEVLEPQGLRERVIEGLKSGLKMYG